MYPLPVFKQTAGRHRSTGAGARPKINEEEEEYQTQLDYIALAEEYEEKEYQKIDFENTVLLP